MSESGEKWQRDTTAYVIFRCAECGQCMYVKSTQKTKRCLRCRKTYKVPVILDKMVVEEVNGMTNAVERVKELQHQLALKQLGNEPDLATPDSFAVASCSPRRGKRTSGIPSQKLTPLEQRFLALLRDVSAKYEVFPFYLLGLASIEYGFEANELELLVRTFVKKGILVKKAQNYYHYTGDS